MVYKCILLWCTYQKTGLQYYYVQYQDMILVVAFHDLLGQQSKHCVFIVIGSAEEFGLAEKTIS